MKDKRNTEFNLIHKLHDEWCLANGYRPQAPSDSSFKPQASSPKQQDSSFKPQAASSMIREPS